MMGRALAVVLRLWLVWIVASGVAAAEGAPATGSLIIDGRRVFETSGCGGCHAVWATDDAIRVGPDLGEEGAAWHDVMEFAGALWNHLPGMAARMHDRGLERVTFRTEDMRALTAYLFYARFVGAPGDPDRGRTVFEEKGCATCHQFRGRGGRTGPRLDDLREFASVAVFARALWNHAPTRVRAGTDHEAASHRLDDRDVADVVAFVRGGARRPEPIARAYVEVGSADAGRAVFERFGCVWCHEPSGTAAAVAPNLAAEARLDISGLAAAFWNHGPAMTTRMAAVGLPFPTLGDVEMADLLAYLAVQRYAGTGGDRARGTRLFRDKSCAGCHRPATAGEPAPASDLRRSDAPRSWSRWATAIWNHPTTMLDPAAPWPRFEGGEMRDLVASLRAEPSPR